MCLISVWNSYHTIIKGIHSFVYLFIPKKTSFTVLEECFVIMETILIFIKYVMNVNACAKLESPVLYKIQLVFRITFEIQLLEMLITIFMLSSLESWITP